MAKGNFSKKRVQNCEGKSGFEKSMKAAAMGEKLSCEFIMAISSMGFSFEALVADAYALSKVWVMIREAGIQAGVDLTELFEELQVTFAAEAKEILNEIKI